MMKGVCGKGGMHGKGGMYGERGHGWQGGMHGKGACMAGGMHGRGVQNKGGWGHVWQGGMCGWGACMAGGHAWQERWPLQRTVRILLEYILVSKNKIKNKQTKNKSIISEFFDEN